MIEEQKVLALKYRPQKFEDLVGQSTISQTLSLALDSNRLSHAYLFSGLRGSGKTSTARIMAKALICQNGPTSKPCDTCESCLSANVNKHLDIIEMDAASNRGIDDIKDLIEHTKYKPSSARFKVFIIDEVHMLTTQAFNALLKTLEEPPGFVKFILATTDPLKLPATILSRTQHFRFKKIAHKDVMHHLSHILNEENVEFDTSALEILSRSGQGSLRDTLTLLDQAIIFAKGKVTTSAVTDMLGLIDPAFMDKIFEVILKKQDITQVLIDLEDYEAGQICDEMTIYLKEKMLLRDPKFDLLIFDRFFRVIADSKYLLSLNSDSGFVLILMLNKMIESTNLKTIENIIEEVESIETKEVEVKTQPIEQTQHVTPVQVSPQSEPIEYNEPIVEPNPPQVDNIEQVEEIKEEVQEIIPASIEETPLSKSEQTYKVLIDKVYDRSHELGECFQKNFIYKEFTDNKLFITSFALDDDRKLLYKNFALIRSFVEEIFGHDVEIEFEKGEKKKEEIRPVVKEEVPVEEEMNSGSMIEDIEMGSGCVADMSKTANPTPSQKETQIEDVLNSVMLNKAKELFDVRKITVKSKT
jgi:DNA polymerase-3 subunit gamma/tau